MSRTCKNSRNRTLAAKPFLLENLKNELYLKRLPFPQKMSLNCKGFVQKEFVLDLDATKMISTVQLAPYTPTEPLVVVRCNELVGNLNIQSRHFRHLRFFLNE